SASATSAASAGSHPNPNPNNPNNPNGTAPITYTPADVIPARRPVLVQIQGRGARPAAVATTTTTTAAAAAAAGMPPTSPSDASNVSPMGAGPEQGGAYHLRRALSSHSTRVPQRMGTVSSGGVFTVSPPS